MIDLTDKQIQDTYSLIAIYHQKYLKKLGVKLSGLYNGDKYTKDALVLVYLAYGYPSTKIVSKQELTEFIRKYYKNVNDVQQARHLAAQKGWYILSGGRKDMESYDIPRGCYKLVTLKEAYPGFKQDKRSLNIDEDDWIELKKLYNFRCATCGSKEGEPHLHWPKRKTVLQKGHMDPRKPLKPGNIIPQCEICNRADRNRWIYDEKGRVIKIANPSVVLSCDKDIQKKIYMLLYKKFDGKNPDEC